MTFDEYGRREVARRLRERAPETYVGLYEAVMGRQVAPDSRWGDDARELCERLAGLIEPRVEDRPGKVRAGERLYVAADYPCGSPLRAGDEVVVDDVTRHSVVVHAPGGQCWHVTVGQLTRERPDSWGLWRDDLEGMHDPRTYCRERGIGGDDCDDIGVCACLMADDMERRARALAERRL